MTGEMSFERQKVDMSKQNQKEVYEWGSFASII